MQQRFEKVIDPSFTSRLCTSREHGKRNDVQGFCGGKFCAHQSADDDDEFMIFFPSSSLFRSKGSQRHLSGRMGNAYMGNVVIAIVVSAPSSRSFYTLFFFFTYCCCCMLLLFYTFYAGFLDSRGGGREAFFISMCAHFLRSIKPRSVGIP